MRHTHTNATTLILAACVGIVLVLPRTGAHESDPIWRLLGTSWRQSQQDETKHCIARGGGTSLEGDDASSQTLEASSPLDSFHIHGWRWHTMSMVRETGRLHKLALRTTQHGIDIAGDATTNDDDLRQAASYVLDFNMRALHRIEKEIFFPWMREKLSSVEDQQESSWLETEMDTLEAEWNQMESLSSSIRENLSVLEDQQTSPKTRVDVRESVAKQSGELETFGRSIFERENKSLVPAIAKVVPVSEQIVFSKKVLRGLGLLDSRVHLVGMHQAVVESNDPKEQSLFERDIPSIPRRMIPRWKRKLYDPKANMLQES